MASKKFYADINTQTNVRLKGDAVDTTSGGTASSDKVITSGAAHAGLATKAALAGSTSQNFSTNDLTVNGNLTINGEINQQSVNNLQVDDREIKLNNGGTLGANTSGLVIDGSGVTTDAELYYDGGDNTWYIKESDASAVAIGTSTFNGAYSNLTGIPSTFAPSAHTHAADEITSGTFADALISSSNVTQHQGSLSIGWSQLTSVPSTFAPAAHNHAASDINSGTFNDARIASSNVTQHEGDLAIAWTQLTSIPEVAQMYKKAFSGSPTSVTCTMPSAVAAANAIVQVIDNNFDVIDCQIDRTAASADIVVSFDTALSGGTVLITSYDGSISTNSL